MKKLISVIGFVFVANLCVANVVADSTDIAQYEEQYAVGVSDSVFDDEDELELMFDEHPSFFNTFYNSQIYIGVGSMIMDSNLHRQFHNNVYVNFAYLFPIKKTEFFISFGVAPSVVNKTDLHITTKDTATIGKDAKTSIFNFAIGASYKLIRLRKLRLSPLASIGVTDVSFQTETKCNECGHVEINDIERDFLTCSLGCNIDFLLGSVCGCGYHSGYGPLKDVRLKYTYNIQLFSNKFYRVSGNYHTVTLGLLFGWLY